MSAYTNHPSICQPLLLPPFLPHPTSLTCSTPILLPHFSYLPPSLPHHPLLPNPPPLLVLSFVQCCGGSSGQRESTEIESTSDQRSKVTPSHPHPHHTLSRLYPLTHHSHTLTFSLLPLPSLLFYTHSLCNATSSEPCTKAFLIPVE